jgi:hypothetical protein
MKMKFDDKNKRGIRDRVGDAVEKVGHKISDTGAPKVGQKIHDLGDKLEKNHQNPDHPHET